MRRLVLVVTLLATLALTGCAGVPPAERQAVPEEEWPTGPGTIPPSWYDYNPALKHWFDPWYNNPYTPK